MFTEFLIVAGVHFIALISPGPDFFLVTKYSLDYSKKAGIIIASGLATGILCHVALSLTGISLIIKSSPQLFLILKIICSFYLLYLAFVIFKNRNNNLETEEGISTKKNTIETNKSWAYFYKIGLLTNITNPKVIIFFFTILTQIVSINTSYFMKIIYGIEMSLATFLWFTFISLFFSNNTFQKHYLKNKKYLDTFFAIVLIILSIRILI